MLSIPFYSKYE